MSQDVNSLFDGFVEDDEEFEDESATENDLVSEDDEFEDMVVKEEGHVHSDLDEESDEDYEEVIEHVEEELDEESPDNDEEYEEEVEYIEEEVVDDENSSGSEEDSDVEEVVEYVEVDYDEESEDDSDDDLDDGDDQEFDLSEDDEDDDEFTDESEDSEETDNSEDTEESDDLDYIEDDESSEEISSGLDTSAKETNSLSIDDIDSDSYALTRKRINVDAIMIPAPKKNGRKETYKGLTQTVRDMGIVNPVHVMITEGYHDHLEKYGPDEIYTTGYKYSILDGFRRLYACMRNQIEKVEAVVWDFNDPEYGNELSNKLALLINKKQKRSWKETWELFQTLEMESAMSPSSLEYLLELESGDAMKLKDIALATNYPEVWDDLCADKKNLDQSYNALKKLRKEEDQALIDDNSGLEGYEGTEGIVGDASEGRGQITDEDVRELMELDSSGGEELDFGDIKEEEFLGEEGGDLQSTSERHPLDPVLRGKVLARDEYTCQVCGIGKGVSSSIFIQSSAEVHHVLPVMLQLDGSRDDLGYIFEGSDVPKLLLVCSSDHKAIHICASRGGKLGMSKEEFDSLPEHEQNRWRNVAKFAKIILWGEKKSGKTFKKGEHLKLPNKPFWEVDKENTEALQIADSVDKYGRDYETE